MENSRARAVFSGAWFIPSRWAITWIARGGRTGSKNGKTGCAASGPEHAAPSTIPQVYTIDATMIITS